MLFTGSTDHTIDAKCRIAVPSRIRTRLDRERDGVGWYCLACPDAGILRLYTQRGFEELDAQRTRSLRPSDQEAQSDRVFYGLTEYLDMDDKGRIPLPRNLMERVGFGPGTEISLVGAGDKLEMMRREQWKTESGPQTDADGAKRKES